MPFLVVGAFSSQALELIKRSSGFLRWFNLVAGADEPTNVSVYVDDQHVNTVTIGPEQLYTLYDTKDYGTHDLRLMVRPGVRVYTFTFG